MESVYFIKGRKLFGGVCGSSLNQTPFQMSHLIQGEIESGPRSSLVFKQPATISSQPVTTFESKHFFVFYHHGCRFGCKHILVVFLGEG